jgi:hypothetical protein
LLLACRLEGINLWKDVFKNAVEDQERLPREIMADRVCAEWHRHWRLGYGSHHRLWQGHDLALRSDPNSILVPVIAALHAFMHNAEDAAKHQVSVAGYSGVLGRLRRFLTKYGDSGPQPEKIDEALTAYDEIMKEYNSS